VIYHHVILPALARVVIDGGWFLGEIETVNVIVLTTKFVLSIASFDHPGVFVAVVVLMTTTFLDVFADIRAQPSNQLVGFFRDKRVRSPLCELRNFVSLLEVTFNYDHDA
jgi:hypothetical protein